MKSNIKERQLCQPTKPNICTCTPGPRKISCAARSSTRTSRNTAVHSLQTGLTAAGNCRIAYGSYTGTGKSGGSYPNRLDFAETLGKAPAFLYVSRENSFDYMFLIRGMTYQTSHFPDFGSSETNSITWTATGVSWSTEYGASPQLNQSGVKYYYVAMG